MTFPKADVMRREIVVTICKGAEGAKALTWRGIGSQSSLRSTPPAATFASWMRVLHARSHAQY
jgi:hypothetical protein